MKKSTKLLTIGAAVLASALCIGFAVSTMVTGISDAGDVRRMDQAAVDLTEEKEESIVFTSIAEYESYLIGESKKAGNRDTEVVYWFPSQIPADATLESIEVDGESVLYTFSFMRDTPEVYTDRNAKTSYNIVPVSQGDDTLIGLLNTGFVKTVKIDTITDIDDFAEDLAADLGCEFYYSNFAGTLYRGLIYTGSSAGNGRLQLVGQQTVFRAYYEEENISDQRDDNPPPVTYYYTPISLTQSEYDNFIKLSPHIVAVD